MEFPIITEINNDEDLAIIFKQRLEEIRKKPKGNSKNRRNLYLNSDEEYYEQFYIDNRIISLETAYRVYDLIEKSVQENGMNEEQIIQVFKDIKEGKYNEKKI